MLDFTPYMNVYMYHACMCMLICLETGIIGGLITPGLLLLCKLEFSLYIRWYI